MIKLVECVPNFSEGRKQEVLDAITNTIAAVPGIILLDQSADKDHNRSVYTFTGTPDGVKEAAFRVAQKAVELIDMTRHKGEHPRMGAIDVLPFIPLKGVTMEECVALSQEVGERLANELKLPVFLYEESATAAYRKNLADIRRGQFEGMADKITRQEWAPDYGTREIHPTAGVVAVGARMPLVAYNINLNTADIRIANAIARIIRESSGGLHYVRAIGVMLEDRNIAQVSINMTNYQQTPLYRVFELVKTEAKRYGVGILESEIVGLTPANALIDSAKYFLQMHNFDEEKQVLENYLLQSE